MNNILRALVILWTLACALWAGLAMSSVIGAPLEAAKYVERESTRQAIAGACCTAGASGTALVAWVVGMIPIISFQLVFRPPPRTD